jgi:flagellar hook-length control protein FliK
MPYPAFTPEQLRIKPALAALAQLRGSSGSDAEWRRLVAQAVARKQEASAANSRDATGRGSFGLGQLSRVDDASRAIPIRDDRGGLGGVDRGSEAPRRDDRDALPVSRANDRGQPSKGAADRADRVEDGQRAGPAAGVDKRDRASKSRRDDDRQGEAGGDEPGASGSAKSSDSNATARKLKVNESDAENATDAADETTVDEADAENESKDAAPQVDATNAIDPGMAQADAVAGDVQALAAAASGQGGNLNASGSAAKDGAHDSTASGSARSAGALGHLLGANTRGGDDAGSTASAPSQGTPSNQAKLDASGGTAAVSTARSTEAAAAQPSSTSASPAANASAMSQPAGQSFQSTLDALTTPTASANHPAGRVDAPTTPATQTPEAKFADDNAGNIVQQVQTKLLPRGGQMQIRLDPPEMGALLVKVSVIDGRMTATFTAENEAAADLLGNNLHQLKSSLESSGVQVERMQVRTGDVQTNSSSSSKDSESKQQQDGASNASSWQQQHAERQRREQVQKMWDKLAGLEDLDLVA